MHAEGVAMNKDVIDVIGGYVVESTPDLCARLEAQTQQLAAVKCSEPAVGRWLEANDLNYLEAAFDLSDQDFTERFPHLPPTTRAGRKLLMVTFNKHVEECPHCSLKYRFEQELDSRIERSLQENRESLLRILEADLTQESCDLTKPLPSA
jgi:hypothetical protein